MQPDIWSVAFVFPKETDCNIIRIRRMEFRIATEAARSDRRARESITDAVSYLSKSFFRDVVYAFALPGAFVDGALP